MADNDNKVVDLPDRQIVREEASLWVARLDSRENNPDVLNELQNWLNKSPTHREEFRRLSALWGEMDILDDLNYLDDSHNLAEQTTRYSNSRWLKRIGGIAALLLIAIASHLSTGPNKGLEQHATFHTNFGEVQTIALSDGSTLTLNTDTTVEVAMSGSERRLNLLKGEAHFAVAKDASRPFSVYAGHGLVRAVGTAFSVYLKKRDVEVIVSEGRVELMANTPPVSGGDGAQTDASNPTLLKVIAAGDQAVMADDGLKRLEPISEIAINRKLSWRSGMLAFAGDPLSDVLEQVSRYTDVRVEIADAKIAALPVGGYFKVGELDGLLEALETTFGIRAEWVDEKHVRITQSS